LFDLNQLPNIDLPTFHHTCYYTLGLRYLLDIDLQDQGLDVKGGIVRGWPGFKLTVQCIIGNTSLPSIGTEPRSPVRLDWEGKLLGPPSANYRYPSDCWEPFEDAEDLTAAMMLNTHRRESAHSYSSRTAPCSEVLLACATDTALIHTAPKLTLAPITEDIPIGT